MEISTTPSFSLVVEVGEGIVFGNWLGNTIAIEDFDERRKQFTRLNPTIPVAFFEVKANNRRIYVEAIRAYLYGVPNAAVYL